MTRAPKFHVCFCEPRKSGVSPLSDHVLAASRAWIERLVVRYNLCPFAKRELDRDRVRFVVCEAADEEALLRALESELQHLEQQTDIETTFIVHPRVLGDFYAFNDFLGRCERLLKRSGLEGVYQIASFHPNYQFAGTSPEDAENYSNRSPYPMLHLLREASVERAIAAHPDVDSVPLNNINTLNALGSDALGKLWRDCLDG